MKMRCLEVLNLCYHRYQLLLMMFYTTICYNLVKMVASLLAFVITSALLIIYSGFDIRKREVPNHVMLLGGTIGAAVNLISGHFYENMFLHIFALSFTIPISYILFRLGAFGGADVKVLVLATLISPGSEFVFWLDPLTEAIIASGIEMMFMLSIGYLWWHQAKKHNENALHPPLIPLLFIGYIFVTSLAGIAYFF